MTPERIRNPMKCAQCKQPIEGRAMECDECGAWPLCHMCKIAHREDGEHWNGDEA